MPLNYQQFALKSYILNLFSSSINEQEIKFDSNLKEIFQKIGNQNQIAEFLFKQLGPNDAIEIEGELKNVEHVELHPSKPDFLILNYRKPKFKGDTEGTPAKQEMKVGRFIKSLLDQFGKNGLKPKEKDLEDFVTQIFISRGGVDDRYQFKVVKGKDVQFYYDEKNSECISGGLGGSCMRYSSKNDFMSVYAKEFKDVVSLLIKVNKTTKKIVGRALIWKTEQGLYLDRIYASDDKLIPEFEQEGKQLGCKYSYRYEREHNPSNLSIKIDTIKSSKDMPKKMPYMDTFRYGLLNNDIKEFTLFNLQSRISAVTMETLDIQNAIRYVFDGTDGIFRTHIYKSKVGAGIIELRDGLTLEILKEKYGWILEADIKDAILGVNNYSLVWYDGTWIDGRWEYATWMNGTWKNGKWVAGLWKDGIWEDGIWINGIWKNGIWRNGTWISGDYFGYSWLNGTWKDGTWHNGEFCNGVWENGTWKKGTFTGGVWNDGTWENGKWYNATWNDGTWEKGIWWSGKWNDGSWESGEWKDKKNPHPNER